MIKSKTIIRKPAGLDIDIVQSGPLLYELTANDYLALEPRMLEVELTKRMQRHAVQPGGIIGVYQMVGEKIPADQRPCAVFYPAGERSMWLEVQHGSRLAQMVENYLIETQRQFDLRLAA